MSEEATTTLPIGARSRSMGRTITEGEFCLLNTLSWSISELHTNKEVMATSRFHERLLAGTMLLALVQGLHDSSDGLREMEEAHAVRFTRTRRLAARFRAPVLPGDTLWAETELQSTGVAADGSGQVAVFRDVATNQRGETVAELERHVSFGPA